MCHRGHFFIDINIQIHERINMYKYFFIYVLFYMGLDIQADLAVSIGL